MPNTVTSFFTFVAGGRARASEANTNFSNFRGDFLPIEEDTQTASHREHDLGASDHYWDNAFLQTIQLGITTTAASTLTANASGGVSWNLPTTTAQFDFQIAGSTIASITNNGLRTTAFNMTFSAASGTGAFMTNTTSYETITSLELTITSNGNPIEIQLLSIPYDGSNTNSRIILTGGTSSSLEIALFRDSSILSFNLLSVESATNTVANPVAYWPASAFKFIDTDPTTTAKSYIIKARMRTGNQGGSFHFQGVRMMARELI